MLRFVSAFFVMICMSAMLLASVPAHAQRVSQLPSTSAGGANTLADGIAVIVNDEVISKGDVRGRMLLALLSAGMPNNAQSRAKIFPQVMRALIEEKLIMQEAQKMGVNIMQEEVDGALAKIALDNRVPGGNMEAFLKNKNIPFSTLLAQVKSSIAWNFLVMRVIRPRIEISDDEIESAVESLNDNAGKQEFLVSEIFLAVDKDSDEEQVKAFADKLYEQINGGAVFSAVARQFSQGTGAAAGGDIGWIRGGELAPEINSVLEKLEEKNVSKPIRSGTGYHIVGLRKKRVVAFGDPKDVQISLGQVVKSFTPAQGPNAAFDEADAMREQFKSCQDVQTKLAGSDDGWRWKELGEIKPGTAPKWLAKKVANLAVGEASEPMATDKSVLMIYLCGREAPKNIDRNKIRQAIGVEKIQRTSRGFLRDLRRDAFMDVRLNSVP